MVLRASLGTSTLQCLRSRLHLSFVLLLPCAYQALSAGWYLRNEPS